MLPLCYCSSLSDSYALHLLLPGYILPHIKLPSLTTAACVLVVTAVLYLLVRECVISCSYGPPTVYTMYTIH